MGKDKGKSAREKVQTLFDLECVCVCVCHLCEGWSAVGSFEERARVLAAR